jgi:SAM-dependent methyltransferase
MIPVDFLRRSMKLQQQYFELYEAYLARGINETLSSDDRENNFDSPWKLEHYFDVGADALRLIVGALVQGLHQPPGNILDFPSGSGRVTRHLKAFFPDARVVASDLYDFHFNFCAKVLGAEPFQSKENFSDIDFGMQFDVIFCGSLLTHLPDYLFRDALRLMSRSLTKRGVALITLHGRHIEFLHKYKYQFIEVDRFAKAQSTLSTEGFGYVDYNDDLLSNWWFNQARYGVSLNRPHWPLKQMEDDYDVRILNYSERAWDNSQDVLVIGKPGVNAWNRPGDVPDPESVVATS